jgi:acetyl esterase
LKLDPQARAVLDRVARANLPSYAELDPPAARAFYRDTRGKLSAAPAEVARVEDLDADGLRVRHYRPLGAEDAEVLPALVYFHGGGWTIGDLDTHDVPCRELANLARCAVLSVDYRLAPEHKFPAAVEDAVAAVRWVHAHAGALRIDPARIAVGGDSAGGNLAAVAALALRDAGGPPLAMQALFYPATDMAADAPSHFELAEGHLLTRDAIVWFMGNYLRRPEDVADWRASPLRAADLSGLPPAYVVTAGFDPLRDEGQAYAEALERAGVAVTYECFEGMIHGFITMAGVIAAGHHALYRVATGLRQRFAALAAERK